MKKVLTTTLVSVAFFLSGTLTTSAKAKTETLLQTYQRELAFLQAQKRSLEKQSKVIEEEFVEKVQMAKKDLDRDQNQLVKLTKTNELTSSRLMEAERNLENIEGANSLLDTTLTQGKVTLSLDEKEWEKINKVEDKISLTLKGALDKLQDSGKVHHEDGQFFTREGTFVKGSVIRLGNIASFATYEGKSSNLLPVGLGKLKMAEADLTETLKKFKADELIQSIPVFLYESTSKGVEMKKDKTFMEIVEAGGSIAYVIVGLGLIALVLVVIRGFLLYTAGRFDKGISEKIQNGQLEEVQSAIAKKKTPFDRVLGKTLQAQFKDREARETIIHESILGELNFLDKFGAVILVMAAVAPLLGLLGTVTGMISTFDIITEFGTGDPKMLSSGISEALITTKLGLMVAIPSLLLGNLLSGWSNKIKIMLEREAFRLSNHFEKA